MNIGMNYHLKTLIVMALLAVFIFLTFLTDGVVMLVTIIAVFCVVVYYAVYSLVREYW